MNENLICEEFENFNEKLQIHNAALFFQLASIFNLPGLNITVFKYIERCFSIVNETENFHELDFNLICKVLASSSLQTDSEIEVYNAANKWLNYNIEERSKLTKQLLLKVRLNLLSKQALSYLLSESSHFSKNNNCVELLKNRDSFYQNDLTVHRKSRNCNQNMFNILIFEGFDNKERKYNNKVKEFDRNSFQKHKDLTSMLEDRVYSEAVYLKGEAYVFGGKSKKGFSKSVEKYSPVNKTWNQVTDIPDKRQHFCACAFIDIIYLFGGCIKGVGINSCLKFDAKTLKWEVIAKMNITRSRAACAIYEGNIVVSGGENIFVEHIAVESYDVFADIWTPMPNMIEARCNHSLICFKSKLFAIGGGIILNANCEVYDKSSNVFVTLESPSFRSYKVKSVLVGNKIFVFQREKKVVLCYDCDKDKWSEESCEATENISHYSAVKMISY